MPINIDYYDNFDYGKMYKLRLVRRRFRIPLDKICSKIGLSANYVRGLEAGYRRSPNIEQIYLKYRNVLEELINEMEEKC